MIAALGISAAGAVLVPLEHALQGREARYVLERADVKLLFTVTDFLDNDYEALLRAEPELPSSARSSTCADRVGRSSSPRDAGAPLPDPLTGDDLCRDPVHVGHDGRRQGRDADARRNRAHVRRVVDGRRVSAPATGTSSSTRSSTRSG